MKTRLCFTFYAACFLLGNISQAAEEPVLLDSIVAVVNDDIITRSELLAEADNVILQLSERGIPLPPNSILHKQVLERLVVKHLQLQEAAKYGITIDDTMLNDALRRIASQNNLTLEQLRQNLINDGISYTEYRESIREQIAISQVNQGVVNSRIEISEQEIDDYLSNENLASEKNVEYLVSHIMINIPEAAKPKIIQQAKERINDIHQQLEKGANFAQLALANSEDQTALEGGKLGWKQLNQLPSLFARTVSALKRKQHSEPIRSPGGFHILYLEDKRGDSRHITKQVHARHILLIPNAVSDEAATRKKLNELRKQITQGEDFATLAKAHSEDPASAVNGGDLGWASADIFAESFKRVVESLPVNKISEPFKSQFGWHIVEVIGRRDHDDTDDYKREMAYRNIYERKAAEEEQIWLRKLRDTAYIDYRLEEE